MGRDLLDWIREGIKGLEALVAQDLILHAHHRFQKDIVKSLGFDAHIQLLHPKAETSRLLFDRAKDNVESRLCQARKLTESGVSTKNARQQTQRSEKIRRELQWQRVSDTKRIVPDPSACKCSCSRQWNYSRSAQHLVSRTPRIASY